MSSPTPRHVSAPTVHRNGTSREELESQLQEVYRKAGELAEALHNAQPNARDYYLQGDNAIRLATDEHVERLRYVERIRGDVMSIFEKMDAERV